MIRVFAVSAGLCVLLLGGGCAQEAEPTCEDLYLTWGWPDAAIGEFDVLPSALPSAETLEVIQEAQQAALSVEDTEEAWWGAFYVTWRDQEPETYNATCDLFTTGEKLVAKELVPSDLGSCWSRFSSRNDSNFGPAADAIDKVGVKGPPLDEFGLVDVHAWAIEAPEDLISVCRALGYGQRDTARQ